MEFMLKKKKTNIKIVMKVWNSGVYKLFFVNIKERHSWIVCIFSIQGWRSTVFL